MIRALLVFGLVAQLGCKHEAPTGAPSEPSAPPPGPQVHELTANSDPGQVDDTLIAHIQDERWEQAYRLMSKAYRDGVSLRRFQESVSANPYLKTTTLIGCNHIETFEGGVQRRDCILRSEAGNAYAQLFYSRDPEGWRMTGMLIGGTPAFPGPQREPNQPSALPSVQPLPTGLEPSVEPTRRRPQTEVLDPWAR